MPPTKRLDPVRDTMRNARQFTNAMAPDTQANELARKRGAQAAADAMTRGIPQAEELARKRAAQAAADARTRSRK